MQQDSPESRQDASGQPSREDRLDAVIASYLLACESGEAPQRPQIVAAHPDLASDLESYFAGEDDLGVLRRGAEVQQTPGEERGACPRSELPRALGGYEILEEIARGGMGVVYRAREQKLGRIVALKVLQKGQLASRQDHERFLRETLAAAALRHPHIVPILESGEVEGWRFFSMPYIEGGNLAQWNAASALDARTAATLVETVALAVEHAHRHGILHRDLKPGNILIDADGRPYVTDFGLSRTLCHDSTLTRSGDSVGTPAYMSPEQATGRRGSLTPATDVYGLGAILYELLTGRPPFQGASELEVLHSVVHQEPITPSRLRLRVPRDLEVICKKCLEKDPRRRYPGALALANDLRRFLDGRSIHARRWRHCWRFVVSLS